LADKLAPQVGRHVVLGIRPEHFHTHPVGSEGDCCPIRVQLNVVEPLGNDMDIYMATPLHDHVVGRVEAQSGLEINSQVPLYVDLRKVHFFEPGVTGMNLSLVQESAHAVA
jgi:ABC-type sugar transport system ATPase subunit